MKRRSAHLGLGDRNDPSSCSPSPQVAATGGLLAALDGEIRRAHLNLVVAAAIAIMTIAGFFWLCHDMSSPAAPPAVYWLAFALKALVSLLAAAFAAFYLKACKDDLSQVRALHVHLTTLQMQALVRAASGKAVTPARALKGLEPARQGSPATERGRLH